MSTDAMAIAQFDEISGPGVSETRRFRWHARRPDDAAGNSAVAQPVVLFRQAERDQQRSRRHLALVSHAGTRTLVEPAFLPQTTQRWERSKRVLDVLGALMLMVLSAPLMLFVALAIRAGGGAVLFRQQRLGRDGRPFVLYKYRTMVPDAEAVLQDVLARDPELREEWQRNQKLRDDPRITGFGSLLRRTSIDELPQLFNVLRGEMSLVGPRPVLASELARYGESARWYKAVKPGVTGLWQVSGRYGTGYARRVALDIYYVRNQGLWLDLGILLRTVYVVIFRIGAH